MGQTIQVRRGVKANLPTLNNGELALTTDEKDLYIGTPTGNELIGGKSFSSQLAENVTQINETNQLLAEKANQTDLTETIDNVNATNLRIDNLVIPLSPENANIEVTDAHVSVTRNKTFTTLNNRIEQLEIENYLPLKNMITNGSFDDKTNWTSNGSAGTGGSSSVSSEQALFGTSAIKIVTVGGTRREEQAITTVVGHKYYIRAHAYISSYTSGDIAIGVINNGIANALGKFDTTVNGSWQKKDLIFTPTATSSTIRVGGVEGVPSSFTAYFDGVIVLDLTEIFGVGKELSLEEVDSLLNSYGVWFDGIASQNKNMLKHNLDLSILNQRSITENKIVVDETSAKLDTLLTTTLTMPATNLIKNGDFANGDHWTSVGAQTILYVGNECKLIAASTSARIHQQLTFPSENLIYRAALVKSSSNLVGVGQTTSILKAHSGSGQYERLSFTSVPTGAYFSIVDKRTSGWDEICIKYAIALDLTFIFGAGNEPTTEQMDIILEQYENNWFNGSVNPLISYKKMFEYLSSDIKKLEDEVNNIVVGETNAVVGFIDNPLPADFTGQAMVTLSYDDGIRNNYDLALPLHEKHGIPATFNVISSRFDDPYFFSEEVVKNCNDRGVEIASHSHFHDNNFISKTDEEIHFECSESIRLLNAAVGGNVVETIAIPFSQYDERVKAIVQQYFKGVRVFSGVQNDIPPTDRYWLKSAIAVGNTTTFPLIQYAIDTAVANNQWCIIMLHGISNAQTKGQYEISQKLLDQTLAYINQIGRDRLLPVTTRDGLKFSLGVNY